MDFTPSLIRERNEGLLREVSTLRLQKRLQENRQPRASRLVAFTLRLKSALHLPRRTGLARR
jgi:hypothetical protein